MSLRLSLPLCRFAALAAAALVLIACGERPEVVYPTYRDAVRDDAMARGWIPEWFPSRAADIHEIHDSDTNQSMLAFQYDDGDELELEGRCEAIDPAGIPGPAFEASWWPSDIPPTPLEAQLYRYYECEDGGAYLAVSLLSEEAFYWRP